MKPAITKGDPWAILIFLGLFVGVFLSYWLVEAVGLDISLSNPINNDITNFLLRYDNPTSRVMEIKSEQPIQILFPFSWNSMARDLNPQGPFTCGYTINSAVLGSSVTPFQSVTMSGPVESPTSIALPTNTTTQNKGSPVTFIFQLKSDIKIPRNGILRIVCDDIPTPLEPNESLYPKTGENSPYGGLRGNNPTIGTVHINDRGLDMPISLQFPPIYSNLKGPHLMVNTLTVSIRDTRVYHNNSQNNNCSISEDDTKIDENESGSDIPSPAGMRISPRGVYTPSRPLALSHREAGAICAEIRGLLGQHHTNFSCQLFHSTRDQKGADTVKPGIQDPDEDALTSSHIISDDKSSSLARNGGSDAASANIQTLEASPRPPLSPKTVLPLSSTTHYPYVSTVLLIQSDQLDFGDVWISLLNTHKQRLRHFVRVLLRTPTGKDDDVAITAGNMVLLPSCFTHDSLDERARARQKRQKNDSKKTTIRSIPPPIVRKHIKATDKSGIECHENAIGPHRQLVVIDN